jgi:hypothetical protein
MQGRTVRMFMADGSAFGIRQCEILNRTLQSLSVSRGRLSELRDWAESRRAGVYFLLGKDEDGNPLVYIGEAQKVIDRVFSHLREKAFWTEVVVFVNKDENINAKYLEARLISIASDVGRYKLDNGKVQEVPILSRADAAAMEEMIPDIRLILGVLGHPVLDPLLALSKPKALEPAQSEEPRSSQIIDREFAFSGPSFSAKGRVTDEGFVILKGSTAAPEFTVGTPGYARLRERLIENGDLAPINGTLTFGRDVATNSSSAAASIVAGGNRSGPGSWKSNGRSLGELEAESVASENQASED